MIKIMSALLNYPLGTTSNNIVLVLSFSSAAVDSCLAHGLKRRAVGIFKGNHTTASLLKQVSKNYPPAAQVSLKVHEIETRMESSK